MRNDNQTASVPRGVVVPIVLAVPGIAIVLVGSGLGIRPWFVKSFDWLDARGVGHADIDVWFRQAGELVGIALMLIPPLVGAILLRRPTQPATRVA